MTEHEREQSAIRLPEEYIYKGNLTIMASELGPNTPIEAENNDLVIQQTMNNETEPN